MNAMRGNLGWIEVEACSRRERSRRAGEREPAAEIPNEERDPGNEGNC
jgi:hypothetical protein